MRSPFPRHSLFLAVALSLLTACAAASPSSRQREYTGGIFDDKEAQYGPSNAYPASPPGDAGGAAYGGEATASVQSAPAMRSVIDFASDDIRGELTKPNVAKQEPAQPPLPDAGTPPTSTEKPPAESSASKRLVIYTGSMTVLVSATDVAVDKLAARTKELGGYIETQTGNTGANQAMLKLRVPAEKFYDLVNELGSYGQITQKQINAADVTKQVFDIELRLDTAEKSRQRLVDLLKSATKMDEILQIEAQIRRLTEEIEGMKGELRFLQDQVAFSTLAVTFWSSAPPPTAGPTRTRSRFEWINKVGVENVLGGF